jgi:hypothetical protein
LHAQKPARELDFGSCSQLDFGAGLILETAHGLDFGNRSLLILGGAAVHRCDNSLTFNGGFSR